MVDYLGLVIAGLLAYLAYLGFQEHRRTRLAQEIEVLPPKKERKRLRCITYQSYDPDTNSWERVDRYLDENGELAYSVRTPIADDDFSYARIKSVYREGYDAFKEEQLKLGWEDLGKLCPVEYDRKTDDFIDWWRGWFQSARLSWYFTDK